MRGIRNAYKILVGRAEGKRPLRKSRLRWKNNITIDVKNIGCESVSWIQLARNKVHRLAVMNKIINFGFHKRRRMSLPAK
jgi:hypothetical protein